MNYKLGALVLAVLVSSVNCRANNLGNYAQKGNTPWNKGKTNIYSEETKKKMRKAKIGNKNTLGYKHTEEAKQKIRLSKIGVSPWNKGIPMLLETKIKLSNNKERAKKISFSLKGKKQSQIHREHNRQGHLGKKAWNKGLHGCYSENSLLKRSLSQRGERGCNWKGGITKEQKARMLSEHKEWRKKVLKRDSYTCQKCGLVGGELHVHHIKAWASFPELRLDINNGQTLHKYCHLKDTHGWRIKNG